MQISGFCALFFNFIFWVSGTEPLRCSDSVFLFIYMFNGGQGMRTLLVLGTGDARREFVKAARREHCEVIVGSMDRVAVEDAEGDIELRIGDSDQETVLEMAAQYGVAGILGIGNEEAVSAAYAAQRLELAGISYAHARLFHNMLLLRAFQEQHQFQVPVYRDITWTVDVEGMHWPLYVHAADDGTLSYVERVNDMEELYRARRRAMRRSRCGMVVVHERPDICAVGDHGARWLATDLVIRGGHLQPLLWNECILQSNHEDIQVAGYLYPARLPESSRIVLAGECVRFADLLHLQDAQLGIVVCMLPGRVPYIIAAGTFRNRMRMLGFLSALYQHDLFHDVIRMALGQHADIEDYAPPQAGTCRACYIVHVHSCGILRYVHFHRDLEPYIVSWRERERQGTYLYGHAWMGEEVGDLFLQFPDAAVMEEILGRMELLVIVEMDDIK